MQWQGREESSNFEDRRGLRGAGMALGGGASVLILALGLVFGFDPTPLLQLFGGAGAPQQEVRYGAPAVVNPAEDRLASFTKVVFHDTEVVWDDLFRQARRSYKKPTLVLFTSMVDSACGQAESAVGPFYCPDDERVFIDLSFYKDMQRKLNAPGEFARAYVIAHEVGHHVQRLLGYSSATREARGPRRDINQASVRMELQADYLAGVWAFHGQKRFHFLEPGDLESALNAANEIGDDRLQRRSRGTVVPDSFTHGTSAQRKNAFLSGQNTGDVAGARRFVDANYAEL